MLERGAFTWTPGALQAVGVYPITFVVTDNGSSPLSGMSTVNLVVRPGAVPAIPGALEFSADSYHVNEGGSATITVTRTGGSDGMVAVQFSTANGSATAGADYADTYGMLVFEDGETSKTFAVPTLHDATNEGDETVTLTLSGVLGGASLGEQEQATLTIANVEPVLNANPVFTSSGAYSVAENVASVGTVAATDADVPPQTVTFSITGGLDADEFNVTSAGVLSFKVAPDFEEPTDAGEDNVYNLQVTADDGHGGTTVQNITVTVTAANDNVPAFTTLAAFSVAENETSVGTVAATDADQPTQTATFTITGGADSGKFDITSGGVLTFKVAPDFETPTDAGTNNIYDLQVTANDGNGGTMTQNIAVTVTDVSDSVAPHLELGGPAASWTKKQPPVTVAPNITVSGTNLSGGTLTINVNAVGKKKPLDMFQVPSFTAFGTSSGVTFANGHVVLQIALNSNATAAAVQAFLRGIKFSTKGGGLKVPTRTATVTLGNASAQSSTVSQTINVHAK